MFSEANIASQPYDTSVTAEQPWVNTKFSVYDSDIEIRSADGFVFQLHRVVLGVTTGAFPGAELETGGEVVQLTEPANVLGILFAFIYPKAHPDLYGESFEVLAGVAEAAAKYEVFSAVDVCNERLLKFLPQHAPEILAHAVKHDYRRLISATLPHFARAPLVSVLEKLPPLYVVPWVQYHEAWRSLFKELALYIDKISYNSAGSSSCHDYLHRPDRDICTTCLASLRRLIRYLEEIDSMPTLRDALSEARAPKTNGVVTCCKHNTRAPIGGHPICPFVKDVTKLFEDKIEKLPSFATLLGLKV